ncbi:hypothetical protein FJT64_008848 [Amphibalanus amphitrite]|uniref:Uncharacterized protein n=1 Tax=Amphibalanus amphitrite TaxID=1232801 RepID=A0A6A4VNX3_AMPAM|nr:hypothetical protein FJT64_008848 [Amphibalanus amphitrite]
MYLRPLILLVNITAINAFTLVYRRRALDFGVGDRRLLLYVYGVPCVLAVSLAAAGQLGPSGAFYLSKVVVDVSALTRGVRLLSVEVPLTAVPAGPAASPAADIERGTCPPPFGPLQLLQSAAQLSVSVSLAVPLDLLPRPAPARCAYGRLLAVVSQRGLQRSGVLQLIQQLNEPPSPAAAEGAAPRRPGDVSTPGISGFCLADRQLHLLFAEGSAADGGRAARSAAPRRSTLPPLGPTV